MRKLGLAASDEEPSYEALSGGVSSEIWRTDLRRGQFCVKRALARLRVEREWIVPIERNHYECAWMRVASAIVPDAVPKLIAEDEQRHLFVMEYLPPESHPVWKTELHRGHADPAFAAQVGAALGKIHAATAYQPAIAAQFPTDSFFYSLRLEPYLEATAAHHPDLARALLKLIDATSHSKHVLVHGDVSPKNILAGPKGPVFLDAECAWYGDPAFDLAFCLNHLLLKCLWVPGAAPAFLECFDALRETYMMHVNWEPPETVERRTAALLPGLLLARVDGKSPVEYLSAADQELVRKIARPMIARSPRHLETIRTHWAKELAIG